MADLLWNFIAHWLYPALLVVFFFGLTIYIHEFGHFLMAKKRGMKIERFSFGFGPKIFSWEREGIEYRVSWILIAGGYVVLPQMAPMEAIEGKTKSSADELPPAAPSSKFLTALAGPVMNLLCAIPLACIVWLVGLPKPVNPSVVGWVEPGSLEEQLGIKPGDRIIRVEDRPVKTWEDIMRAVAISRESNVDVVIERDGQKKTYSLEAKYSPTIGIKTLNLYSRGRPYARQIRKGSPAERAGIRDGDRFLSVEGIPVSTAEQLRDLVGKRTDQPTAVKVMRAGKPVTLTVTPEMSVEGNVKVGRMGVVLGDDVDYVVQRPGPTPLKQFADIFSLMGDTVTALMHSKQTGVGVRSLSGPVGIVGGFWYEITRGGVLRGLWFAIMLNLNLAVFNLLPVPVLDGGHMVFALIEAIRRRPLPTKLIQATQTGFAALLIAFMLYVTVFDIQRMIPWPIRRSATPQQTNEPAPGGGVTNHP